MDYYLKELSADVSFLELMDLAEQRDEVLLGYRREADKNDVEKNLGVTINPDKNMKISPEPGGCLIALSEDEL